VKLKGALFEGQVRLEREILRTDPFTSLPGPIRFLASVTLNLHPRRIWALSSFALTLQPSQPTVSVSSSSQTGRIATEYHGAGVTAITFLNPLPDALAIQEQASLSSR
jgi:hypothetical protein